MLHRCGHDNCFTCPFPDCIVGRDYGESRVKEKRTPEQIRAAKAESRRRYIEKAFMSGLCIVCRKAKPEEGRKTCAACLKKSREEYQKTKLRGITR